MDALLFSMILLCRGLDQILVVGHLGVGESSRRMASDETSTVGHHLFEARQLVTASYFIVRVVVAIVVR